MNSIRLALALALLLLPSLPALAQITPGKETAVSAATLSTALHPEAPSVSLGLKAEETLRTFDLTVQNDEEQPLKVFGAQTTAGLYVVEYPREIAAKGRAAVTLLYVARQNSTATADLLRLMTSRGEKTVQIDHGREAVVQYEATTLQWTQDEPAVAKAITLTIPKGNAAPKGVKVMGAGNRAEIESLGDGRYRISVTPGSTAKPQQFPVLIQFAPALPETNTVIVCSVLARG